MNQIVICGLLLIWNTSFWHTCFIICLSVPLLIVHMLPLSCYRKKLQNLSHLNCGFQIRQIWIQLITACEKCCKRRCTKHASLLWAINDATDEWLPQWRHSPAIGLIGPLCSQSLFQLVQISSACFAHLVFRES